MQNYNEVSKEEVIWTRAPLSSLFPVAEAMWPAAASSCQPAFPTTNDCTLPLWAQITLFFFQLLLVRLSGHSNQKSSFYREPCAGHPSPGGKLTFKSSFHSTRNGSIHVYGGVRPCTVSWVALGRRRGQAGTGGVGFLLRLWAERTTASQSLISPPFPDPGHPPAPFFISVYLLRDPDSGKKAHFLPVCRTIAREACS